MRYSPQDRTLTPNYDVHDVLACVGMEDAVAVLASARSDPDDLASAGTSVNGRVDRIYLTRNLVGAAAGYMQQDMRASEHQALMLTLDGATAARATKAAACGTKAEAARPGGLRGKVLAHLRANPGSSFTPHEIHKVNGHSSGAIANALDTLVKHGDAELATEKTRRFRLAGSAAAPAGAQPPGEPGSEDTGAGDETDLAGAA